MHTAHPTAAAPADAESGPLATPRTAEVIRRLLSAALDEGHCPIGAQLPSESDLVRMAETCARAEALLAQLREAIVSNRRTIPWGMDPNIDKWKDQCPLGLLLTGEWMERMAARIGRHFDCLRPYFPLAERVLGWEFSPRCNWGFVHVPSCTDDEFRRYVVES